MLLRHLSLSFLRRVSDFGSRLVAALIPLAVGDVPGPLDEPNDTPDGGTVGVVGL